MSTAELIQRYNDALQEQSDIIDEMFRLLTSVVPAEELDKTGLLLRISRVASILYGIQEDEIEEEVSNRNTANTTTTE